MAQLDGGQFISELLGGVANPVRIGQFFQKVIAYVNNISQATATEQGDIQPPVAPSSLMVKASPNSELVHVQISHPGAIQRGVQYFTEIGVNDPGFNQPLVEDHGATRTPGNHFVLPTNDDNGVPINYYFRSYAQYLGGKRSDYAYWGNPKQPTAVKLNGTTNMTPLSSTGSGTASNTGTQGGQGLGNDLFRAAASPKRATGQV